MSFLDQVMGASSHRSTKADVIEWYRSEYPSRGKGSWKQHLIADLSSITGIKPKNLEKRFDTQRRDNPEPRNTRQYEVLGGILPKKAPAGGFHIWGTLTFKVSEECEEREIDEVIEGQDAAELIKMGETAMLQAVINQYMGGDAMQQSVGYVSAECGDPDLNVEPIEE